jgi:hypothetical protein
MNRIFIHFEEFHVKKESKEWFEEYREVMASKSLLLGICIFFVV